LQCGIVLREWGWITGAILSVELNTWFLILRRVAYKRSDLIPSLIGSIINCFFYVTWIIVRMIIYPAIWFKFIYMVIDDYVKNGLAWHFEYIVVVAHTALVLLNLKWSYDLFLPFFITSNSTNGIPTSKSYRNVSEGL
jgi:hypothetical protein